MRSSAPKQAESEFDDLLGQLVDELAMTPASESAVSLVPDPPPAEARVDSTQQLAAEAADAARARVVPAASAGSNNAVKIVGLVALSLSAVAIAALFVFTKPSVGETVGAALDVSTERLEAERTAAKQRAADQLEAERLAAEKLAAEQAAREAEQARLEAEAAAQAAKEAEAKAQAAAAAKPKPRTRTRSKPKPKPATTKVRDSFDDL
jgi:hypothetical protein